MGIIKIKETIPGSWEAKYRGNYGVYNIHATIDRGAIVGFKCSCPSKHQRCKHLFFTKKAIENQKIGKKGKIWRKVKEMLKIFTE
jgi:hypothetical protein